MPAEGNRVEFLRRAVPFAFTALAAIVGCYLPWLVLKQDTSIWLLLPAAVSLGLLTLHPAHVRAPGFHASRRAPAG